MTIPWLVLPKSLKASCGKSVTQCPCSAVSQKSSSGGTAVASGQFPAAWTQDGSRRSSRQRRPAASGNGNGPDRPIPHAPPDGCRRFGITPDRRFTRVLAPCLYSLGRGLGSVGFEPDGAEVGIPLTHPAGVVAGHLTPAFRRAASRGRAGPPRRSSARGRARSICRRSCCLVLRNTLSGTIVPPEVRQYVIRAATSRSRSRSSHTDSADGRWWGGPVDSASRLASENRPAGGRGEAIGVRARPRSRHR